MKKIIVILIISITTFAFSQEQETANKIDVNANWSGRGCRGTNGLCNIEISSKTASNATLQYDPDETLRLIIYRTKLSSEEESKIVRVKLEEDSKESTLIFIMDDDFELTSQTKTTLKIPQNISSVITKGEYPVEITSDYIIISFKIK